MSNRILDVVHNTAKDLHEADILKVQTMRQFDALCLPEVKPLDALQIKAIRETAQVSQTVFAAYLNTSTSSVRQWEQGVKSPRGATLKLLSLVAQKGLGILI